jgi:hypothetical protein
VTAVNVVLFGLNTIIPLMTEDLLRVNIFKKMFLSKLNHFTYLAFTFTPLELIVISQFTIKSQADKALYVVGLLSLDFHLENPLN